MEKPTVLVPMEQEVIKYEKVYRKYDNRPVLKYFSPMLRSPVTDTNIGTVDLQMLPVCAQIELNTMKCLEAYGTHKGPTSCKDYLDDLQECHYFHKQTVRAKIMRDERRRQYDNGERKLKYAAPPREGSFFAGGQEKFGNYYAAEPK